MVGGMEDVGHATDGEERVAHVVIERPEKRNAMSRMVLEELAAHAAELAGTRRVGCGRRGRRRRAGTATSPPGSTSPTSPG
jgi:1,4-dihydroxy-2-naphthoyl-CoA synthase